MNKTLKQLSLLLFSSDQPDAPRLRMKTATCQQTGRPLRTASSGRLVVRPVFSWDVCHHDGPSAGRPT